MEMNTVFQLLLVLMGIGLGYWGINELEGIPMAAGIVLILIGIGGLTGFIR